MTSYQTIVVGTDGSDTSLRAVDKAASLAAESGGRLIIASAYSSKHHDAAGPIRRAARAHARVRQHQGHRFRGARTRCLGESVSSSCHAGRNEAAIHRSSTSSGANDSAD